jgi:myo-inositol-1(or 4)-monophosphatase
LSSKYNDKAESVVRVLNESARKLKGLKCSDYQTKNGKSGVDLVTQADRDIQEHIISFLQEEFPEAGIIAEEDHGIEEQDKNFIIDPIDGTTNYSAGRRYHSISIAYQEYGEVVVGGIASPEFECGIISVGIRNEGAWIETEYSFNMTLDQITDSEAMKAESNRELLEESLGMVEASSVKDIEDEMSEIRKELGATYTQPGSAALELVEIARGTIDFRIDTIDIWDYAAGHVIVEEAGGDVTSKHYFSQSIGRELIFTAATGKGFMQKLKPFIQSSGFAEGMKDT